MRRQGWLLACLILMAAGAAPSESGQTRGTPGSGRVLFEGARLIIGDASAPIEDSAFVVEGSRIMRVGKKGEIALPEGATRVDLTGKTVMPTLIGAHIHVGLLKGMDFGPQNYSRETMIDHLKRYAYYGVGAVLTIGTDVGPLSFEVRNDRPEGAARLLTCGRGMAAPDAGPGIPSIAGTSFAITSAEEGRKRVRELAAAKADCVKIWVDDRGGRVKKLPPDLYGPIIEEAHKHGMQAIAHVYYLKDAHELVKAGINGFVHLVRDEVMDDALIAMMRERDVFITPNIGGSHRATLTELPAAYADLLAESVPADVVEEFRKTFSSRDAKAVANSRATYDRLERSLAKLRAARVTLALGGDTGIPGAFHGSSEQYELERMAAAGMTPAEVIVAATSAAARVTRQHDLGTIAAGKRASFIVLDANPLENIANTRRISAVYVEGRPLDRAALRARWTATGGGTQ